jgi:hypothetical protein
MEHGEVGHRRRRTTVGPADRPCELCGGDAVLTESRAVRRGAEWLNPRWRASVRVYELCGSCGAKTYLEDVRRPL